MYPLSERQGLGQRKINVPQSWPAKGVSTQCTRPRGYPADRVYWRPDKSSAVEVLQRPGSIVEKRVTSSIVYPRPRVARLTDMKRKPSLGSIDTGKLPAGKQELLAPRAGI